MKLLLDANISWRITAQLQQHFDDCKHIDRTELNSPAKDIDIWNYALKNNFIIVTNDDDFLHFINTKNFPPKIILLRTGNQSSDYIAKLLIRHKPAISDLHFSEELGLLEIY